MKCKHCGKDGATSKVRTGRYIMYFCNQKCISDYKYACWKGDRGPGKLLKEIIKDANDNRSKS